ncbi:uncharacterized protein PRCAT00002348001 [Priceomyces carsonii]|uniref:uncharacterized protein n=1 Tax=Priceomyces carsonii TaxID=28549 RepID=UPI002EDB957F|nr:unnamed protein product [Priceomyces carsonii]
MSILRDLIESVVPVAYADEPEEEPVEESTEDSADDSEKEGDDEEEKGDDEEDEEDEEEDDEDDEEEESEDPLDGMRAECASIPACKPFGHHYEECVERVTKEQQEEGYEHKAYKEDCVEEFFHLQHCINDCVAPKLFYKLK